MQCPRLNHFVRLQPNGKFGKCGHMVNAKTFENYNAMQSSNWLKEIKNKMEHDVWPVECVRCQTNEQINNKSIRTDMLERHKILSAIDKNYLIVGGVLDNTCNSACQTCNENLSSRIGSLKKNSIQVNNYEKFWELPTDHVVELDINGGEPTYSKNYKQLLENLPPSVKIIRVNTNGSLYFDTIEKLLNRGIRVILTVSLDGVGIVHDYIRWPVVWKHFHKNLNRYIILKNRYNWLRLNTWTTLSVLNLKNFEQIINFVQNKNIDHEFALLENPFDFSIKRRNSITMECKEKFSKSESMLLQNLASHICTDNESNSAQLRELISKNDSYREISYKDYFNFDPNLL